MMAAYLDASGTTPESGPWLVMAGFVAREDRWTEFEREWALLLADPGYAPLFDQRNGKRYAHAKDMKRWPRDKREAFHAHANYLLKTYVAFGISSCVRHEDYKQAYVGYPLTRKDSIYGFIFRTVMAMTCKNINENYKNSPCSFVLEHGDPNQGGARNIFSDTVKDGRMLDKARRKYNVNAFSIRLKEDFGALQVADMHAYTFSRHLVSPIGKGAINHRRSFHGDINLLLSGMKVQHHKWTKDHVLAQRRINIVTDRWRKEWGKLRLYGGKEKPD